MAGPTSGERAIASALDRAARSEAAFVHLSGPRGSGRTWHLDRAELASRERNLRVVRLAGSTAAATRPFGAVRQLLWECDGGSSTPTGSGGPDARSDPPAPPTVERLRATLLAVGPIVLLIDDVDQLDPDSVEVLGQLARRLDVDPVVIISTAVEAGPWPDVVGAPIRLDPLPDVDVEALLVAGGIEPMAAQRCAELAGGNPGLATALADGLTNDQRRGRAPIAALPRPAGALADELRARLAGYGEPVGRALVVAASEPGGDVTAIRAALATLGESPSSLDDAEEAGLVEIIGPRLIFADPWTALVAPSLVAPASRRAAHRALAGAFGRPDQAAARAWQLAAAANGPSDDVANALGLVAHDAAQRGALRTAVATAERAVEFVETEELRAELLLSALGWAIDADDSGAVRRFGEAMRAISSGVGESVDDSLNVEFTLARTEADAYLHGAPARADLVPTEPGPAGARSAWAGRRERRQAIAAALDRGDHAAALASIDQRANANGTTPSATDLVSLAIAHRHRGEVREARAALLATAVGAALIDPEHTIARDATIGTWTALLVAADLNILAGRGDDATRSLALNAPNMPTALTEWAAVLAGRAVLQTDPTADANGHPDAFGASGSGPLLEVRALVATGVQLRDLDALDEAIALADREHLPIEAGEARLWALPLRDQGSQPRALSAASGALQRCGVRGWDRRIERLAAAPTPDPAASSSGSKAVDPEVAALSAAERRVADAVASGMTNRETAAALIVSVKTVDFHLQQIYRKLGIRSRTELAIRMMNGAEQ